MLRLLCLVLIGGVAAVAGCSSVASVNRIGAAPEDLSQADAFNGVWLLKDSVVHIRHLGDGQLVAAGLTWSDDTAEFEKEELRASVTMHHEVMFLNVLVEPDDEGEPQTYVHLRCVMDEDTIVLHPPTPAYFAAAIEDGRLEGSVRRDHGVRAVITGAPDKLNDLVQPGRAGEQFDLDTPLVLRKLGGP